MYEIDNTNGALIVKFKGNFDYSTIKRILYHEISMPEFFKQNDIWLVGTHRTNIRLGEIQEIVDDFGNLCPGERLRDKRIAIVAQPGLTSAFLQLLANGLDRRLPLLCSVFDALEDAENWIGATKSRVA
ncbi:MAG: hypothetical protein JXR25_01920 [Pontiellaceae bacterium]|nr:hypothetical protein [Pontiellaceae bacterium]MBN2783556.1 hypothetical protein [Pontiellaceae bacterium]